MSSTLSNFLARDKRDSEGCSVHGNLALIRVRENVVAILSWQANHSSWSIDIHVNGQEFFEGQNS